MTALHEQIQACTHCGLCTKHCAFLRKYGMDIHGFSTRPDLAYHCFFCGECTRRCPKGIDGSAVALALRQQRTADAGGKVPEKGYRLLVAEKKNYLFRNYRYGQHQTVLFPGCNFPSFFPKTTDKLIRLLNTRADIGVIFDCCGKPVHDLGLRDAEQQGCAALRRRLQQAQVKRLVVLCPNCYYYLKDTLDIPVIDIYTLLRRLGLGQPIPDDSLRLFLPCPDKSAREMVQQMQPFLPEKVEIVEDIPCCGLGGCAGGKEPEIAAEFCRSAAQSGKMPLHTYCASCVGQLRRGGADGVTHILPRILDIDEVPVTGPQSLWHRAKRVFFLPR